MGRLERSVLTFAIGLCVAACSTSTSSVRPSAAPSTPPAPTRGPDSQTASSSPTTSPTSQWTLIEDPGELPDNSQTVSVSANGEGFVAIIEGGFEGSPIVHSPDGRHWTAAEPLPDSKGALAQDLASAPASIVVVGSQFNPDNMARQVLADRAARPARDDIRLADTCEGEPNYEDAAAWWSADGMQWASASVEEPKLAPISAVTSFVGGYVAVSAFGPNGGSVSWTSADGEAWTRAPDAPELHVARMTDIATDGSIIVAVGFGECPDERPVMWRSTDGLAWDVVDLGEDGPQASSVAAGPAGFLAVGYSGNELAPGKAWHSDDGRSWAPVSSYPDEFLARELVGASDRYLLVTDHGTIWSSAEGNTWGEEFVPDNGSIDSVAVGTSMAVALGSTRNGDETQMAVWIAPVGATP
jgi:hypothetical protein